MAELRIYKPDTEALRNLKATALKNGSVTPEEWRAKFLKSVATIVTSNPKQYHSYGPYWWLLKRELIADGYGQFGDTVDAEWVEKLDYGDWIYNLLAAWVYAEQAIDLGLIYSERHSIPMVSGDGSAGAEEYIEYVLIDEEVDILAYR